MCRQRYMFLLYVISPLISALPGAGPLLHGLLAVTRPLLKSGTSKLSTPAWGGAWPRPGPWWGGPSPNFVGMAPVLGPPRNFSDPLIRGKNNHLQTVTLIENA